jgi:VWFA-related protein
MKGTALGVAAGLTLCLAFLQAQTPSAAPQTFRTGVDVVQLDVSVLDKDHHPVRGLTADDFTVLDAGTPQKIVAFKAVDIPPRQQVTAAWLHDVAPDVVNNHIDAERVVIVVLDDYHVGAPSALYTLKTGRAVIDQLGPADLAAVVYTFNQTKGQEFTRDHARLLASVDRFTPSGFAPAVGGMAFGAAIPTTACYHGECVTATLRNVAESLRGWPGVRKSLVLVSPQPIFNLGPQNIEQDNFEGNINGIDSFPDLKATFDAMQRANVNVYQFDPRGVLPGGIDPNFGMFSDHTGGRAFSNTNTPWARVPDMFEENSSYYVLGFQAATTTNDAYRSIKVKVARPGVEVRNRSGYVPPGAAVKKDKATNKPPALAVDKAMGGALPQGDLAMSLNVAPFSAVGKGGAAVAITAGLDLPADLPTDTVELAARALNVGSNDSRSHGVATVRLTLTHHPGATGTVHYDVPTRLDLAPGRYEIRVAVNSPATALTGSAYAPVTIPRFDKDSLTLSGIILGRLPVAAPRGKDPLDGLVPLPPTTIRTFATSDRVAVFFRMYQGGKNAVSPVRLTARLVDAEDRAVFEQSGTLETAAFVSRVASQTLTVPLARLPEGEYLLTIEAVGGNTTVRRDVRLRIKP